MNANEAHHQLVCCKCGARYADRRLACDGCADSLLRTAYRSRVLSVRAGVGMFRFAGWLPGVDPLDSRAGAAMVVSEGYARRLGLRDLTIAFNGYWPERGAANPTGSFKDLEAAATVAYLRDHGVGAVVLASAGNTARAFGYACSVHALSCYLVVPEAMLHRLWLPVEQAHRVRVIVLQGSDDYDAAIRLSEAIAQRFHIALEGGARNVARRDGIGTTILEYATTFGRMPRHYVQAVGSGLGGLAAYEASRRLVADGRFGCDLPALHLVQAQPWTPIHDGWSARADHLADPLALGRERMHGLYADVLAHRRPPYALVGGLRTALEDTRGETYAVTAEDARRAKAAFEAAEGVTINEAAACACAGLEQALARGRIEAGDPVLLHITGGGEDRIRRDYRTRAMRATFVRGIDDLSARIVDDNWPAREPAPIEKRARTRAEP